MTLKPINNLYDRHRSYHDFVFGSKPTFKQLPLFGNIAITPATGKPILHAPENRPPLIHKQISRIYYRGAACATGAPQSIER